MIPLYEAVHRTANKLLDSPEFVPLCRTDSVFDQEFSRIYAALQPLGYARLSFHDTSKVAGGCTLEVHPLAHDYFNKYGQQYVQLLEVTQRLNPNTTSA